MTVSADPATLLVVFLAAVFSGATAAVVGFGIGSIMTPLIAATVGMPAAIAAVTLPHALATAIRCWRLRAWIDRTILWRFGALSAAGGFAGALLYARLGGGSLTRVMGALLVLTAIAQLTGLAMRWHPRGPTVAVLGLASGLFGGVAGNQGGLRSAALSSFGLRPAALVATGTAIGLFVDVARAPVYLVIAGGTIVSLWKSIAVASGGAIAGTFLGERMLLGLSPQTFRRVLAAAVGALGIYLLR